MTRIARVLIAAAAAGLLFSACSAAQDRSSTVLRVAAVVNDDVISDHDLDARTRMILITSGLPVTDETRKRFEPQVLQALIREKLQIQEAKRLNIKVGKKQLLDAVLRLEKRNGIPRGKFFDRLKRRGIEPGTVMAQIHASLSWGRVIGRRIRPFVRISEERVDAVFARIKANQTRPKYRLAVILLSVATPDDEAKALRTAQKLLDQIRRGARFGVLARQFSDAPSGRLGGDLGEVQKGQLDPAIESALDELKVGQVTGPIRTPAGYYIVQLLDRTIIRRNALVIPTVTFAQLVLPYGGPPTNTNVLRRVNVAKRIGRTAKGCDQFIGLGRKANASVAQTMKDIKVKGLTLQMRRLLNRLKINQASDAIAVRRGVQIFMLCGRSEASGLPTRAQVKQQILRQEISIRTQQYLRNLRRNANIDIRG